MQESTITIIVILVAGILVFIVPMMTFTQRVDNVVQETLKLEIGELITDVTNTGKLTRARYQEFVNDLNSSGNTYDVEIEIQHIDENPGVKVNLANYKKIGENVYYSEYTTQVLKQIGIKTDNEAPSDKDTMILKQGDIIYIEVKSSNPTANMTLKSSLLGFSNAGEHAIKVSDSGMVSCDGVEN